MTNPYTADQIRKMLDAATPGPWLQAETTIYSLQHWGWRKGVEQFSNVWQGQFSGAHDGATDEEVVANASLAAAAPDLARQLIDALERQKWQGAKVKPLIWEDHPADGAPVISRAIAMHGTYFIIDDTDDFSGLYLDLVSHDNAQWWKHVRSTSVTLQEHYHGDDLEPLKNKAQADHEARILSALEATEKDTPEDEI